MVVAAVLLVRARGKARPLPVEERLIGVGELPGMAPSGAPYRVGLEELTRALPGDPGADAGRALAAAGFRAGAVRALRAADGRTGRSLAAELGTPAAAEAVRAHVAGWAGPHAPEVVAFADGPVLHVLTAEVPREELLRAAGRLRARVDGPGPGGRG